MYIPSAFAEDRLDVLHAFVRANDFATLVTTAESAPFASHVPMLLLSDCGPLGTLQTHVAVANPQWRDIAAGAAALAIFHGPHAYISPTWYETPVSVPTWNYMVAHAYGVARLMNPAELRTHLGSLTQVYEGARTDGWQSDRLSPEMSAKLQTQIIGIEIEITRIEGKWKLGQNRTRADREGAIAGLRAASDSDSGAIADAMAATLLDPKSI